MRNNISLPYNVRERKDLINQQEQHILSLVEHAPSKLAAEKKVLISKLRNAQQRSLAL